MMSDVLYIGFPIVCLVIGAGWLVWEALRIRSEEFAEYNERMDRGDRYELTVDEDLRVRTRVELQQIQDRYLESVN
jgi:hypothetical protein